MKEIWKRNFFKIRLFFRECGRVKLFVDESRRCRMRDVFRLFGWLFGERVRFKVFVFIKREGCFV